MDVIFIEQLTVMAVVGVYEWEKKQLQKLIFDLEMGWDSHQAAYSDNIVDCLNYTDVSNAIFSLVSGKHFTLVERVAEETAELLMTRFKLPWIRIKVSKIGAIPKATNVGIIIERTLQKK